MPQIWQILMGYGISLKGKSLLDLGGGHGDLCLMAHNSGAKKVRYIDNAIDDSVYARFHKTTVELFKQDIEKNEWGNGFDYISCLSVLPYLQSPDRFLNDVSKTGSVFILECQYAGDGPGLREIQNDYHMESWLRVYWDGVESIGKTLVAGRQRYRTIWVCKNDS